jgi:uncharacterized protein YnzC (UPF0291/DUF896 family)
MSTPIGPGPLGYQRPDEPPLTAAELERQKQLQRQYLELLKTRNDYVLDTQTALNKAQADQLKAIKDLAVQLARIEASERAGFLAAQINAGTDLREAVIDGAVKLETAIDTVDEALFNEVNKNDSKRSWTALAREIKKGKALNYATSQRMLEEWEAPSQAGLTPQNKKIVEDAINKAREDADRADTVVGSLKEYADEGVAAGGGSDPARTQMMVDLLEEFQTRISEEITTLSPDLEADATYQELTSEMEASRAELNKSRVTAAQNYDDFVGSEQFQTWATSRGHNLSAPGGQARAVKDFFDRYEKDQKIRARGQRQMARSSDRATDKALRQEMRQQRRPDYVRITTDARDEPYVGEMLPPIAGQDGYRVLTEMGVEVVPRQGITSFERVDKTSGLTRAINAAMANQETRRGERVARRAEAALARDPAVGDPIMGNRQLSNRAADTAAERVGGIYGDLDETKRERLKRLRSAQRALTAPSRSDGGGPRPTFEPDDTTPVYTPSPEQQIASELKAASAKPAVRVRGKDVTQYPERKGPTNEPSLVDPNAKAPQLVLTGKDGTESVWDRMAPLYTGSPGQRATVSNVGPSRHERPSAGAPMVDSPPRTFQIERPPTRQPTPDLTIGDSGQTESTEPPPSVEAAASDTQEQPDEKRLRLLERLKARRRSNQTTSAEVQ